jgi:PUA domain protein
MSKSRHPIRERDARDVSDALSKVFGAQISWEGKRVEEAEDGGFRLYFVDGVPMAFAFEGRVMPTVKGLLATPATERFVTVDEGAVKFVLNGADIMAPGVVEADPQIAPGDAVWIREEKHKRPLAVGLALMGGAEMVAATKGKAVRSVHHLRDKLWELTQDSP